MSVRLHISSIKWKKTTQQANHRIFVFIAKIKIRLNQKEEEEEGGKGGRKRWGKRWEREGKDNGVAIMSHQIGDEDGDGGSGARTD